MSRRVIGWSAGVGVVLAAVSGGLVNGLDGGWPWWAAAVVVTLTAAVLAGWVAASTAGGQQLEVEEGGVYAGKDLEGPVETLVRGSRSGSPSSRRRGGGIRIGRAAVGAGRTIKNSVKTNVQP